MKKSLLSTLSLSALFALALPATANTMVPVPGTNLCNVDRYEFGYQNLNANDTVALSIGSTQVSTTVNATTALADEWPKVVSELVNQSFASDIASAGSESHLNLLNRYLPEEGQDNIIDVIPEGVPVSLTVNGLPGPLAHSYFSREGSSSGKGIIPGWSKNFAVGLLYNFIILNNVTDEEITMKVKLYAQDGTEYLESTEGGSQVLLNPNSPVSLANLFNSTGATVGPNQSISFGLFGGAQKFGFGKVEWSADTCLDAAVTGVSIRHSGTGEAHLAFNGGQPF